MGTADTGGAEQRRLRWKCRRGLLELDLVLTRYLERTPYDAELVALLDARELSRLRWRCRRGLLENDLFVERFFRHHEETLTTRQAAGLTALMDLSDNDLLDLLLARKEPEGDLRRGEVLEVLALMRTSPRQAPRGGEPSRPGP